MPHVIGFDSILRLDGRRRMHRRLTCVSKPNEPTSVARTGSPAESSSSGGLDSPTDTGNEAEHSQQLAHSGAGKSTLVRLINGLETPTEGRIHVGPHEVTALSERISETYGATSA
jgi:hypothetical protein